MRYTASEISAKLALQAENVCRLLLPGGKKVNSEWKCADLSGSTGDSLGVHLTGDKAGLWSDFASGNDKGDLLDLWAAVRGLNLSKALLDAKEWLGIASVLPVIPPKKYIHPKPKGVVKISLPKAERGFKYLTEVRKLDPDTILAYKVAQRGNDLAYPSEGASGGLIAVKYIGLDLDAKGKKIISQEAGCAPALFGWQACDKKSRICIITEGQIDAMTWFAWSGVNSLSMPNGVGDLNNWIDYEWDNLAIFDRIYLSFDMDDPGRNAVAQVAKRLGIHRCAIVVLPFKDANEALQKGWTGADAARALKEAKIIVPDEIKSPNDFREVVQKYFHPVPGEENEAGLQTPIFGKSLLFRPGELTLWTGHTSHGKSSLLSQIILYAAMANQRTVIGSFEMKGHVLLAKKIACLSLNDKPEPTEIDQAIDWLQGKIWIYNIVGQVTKAKLEELMVYSLMRHGIQHYVIDSLMKCAISSEDYEAQRQFIAFLHSFAIQNNIHIHLVGHPRKDKNDENEVGIYDVHGGNTITSQPDNIISVFRNKKKESIKENGNEAEHIFNKRPDTIVRVTKQRLTGFEFNKCLWFRKDVARFTTEHEVWQDLRHVYLKP